ncbi:allantoicase [Myxococcota bacterium]|nr:allantoicase [Myxococcota bacterium]
MSEIEAFADLVDLLSADVGGRALWCTDDFFASVHNLVKPAPAAFDPHAYTDRGKLMDGWESRRERIPGDDVAILALGVPGRIRGVDLDTSFFLGNHPPFATLEAACLDGSVDSDQAALAPGVEWQPLLRAVPLRRGSHNLFAVAADGRFTHVRLRMHPDGGIARLRVYGEPQPTLPAPGDPTELDLALLTNGGRALACSDMFFSPMRNLVLPGRSSYMGGGWETRRSRPPGMDWIIVALAAPGQLSRVTFDTGWFKGNFPARAALDGLYWPDAPAPALVDHPDWTELVAPARMTADALHELPIVHGGPWTHVRLRILPDGGMARLRVWGRVADRTPADGDPVLAWLNAASPADAAAALSRCCGSPRWVQAMLARRPFGSRTHLHGAAAQAWWGLHEEDWRLAFTHHPRIGADVAALRARFAATAAWSQGEQAGVVAADEQTLSDLARGNQEYEARFGHIFIVCATGLTAAQMLSRLQERLHNDPPAELRIAAGEQARITALRLDKLEVT